MVMNEEKYWPIFIGYSEIVIHSMVFKVCNNQMGYEAIKIFCQSQYLKVHKAVKLI